MRIRSLVVAGLLFASPAYAVDHVMRVDEVVLDGAGGAQYIELHDTSAEGLPSTPYTLKIYDTNGTLTETVTLTGLTAGPSIYYVVGNAAAVTTYSSATFDATLTMALPNPGQACFERSNNSKVHCLAWGCPTVLAGTATTQAAQAPTGGMSLSRAVAGGILQLAIATPDAANSAGTAPTSCTAPVVDAGVMVDAPNNSSPDGGNNPGPDAGTNPGGEEEDDSGCCQSSSPTSALGGGALSLFVLGLIVRRRRRA